MSGSPRRLSDVLGGVINGLGLDRKIDEARAVVAWQEVAGEAISRATESVWARGDVLIVRMNSAAWRSELHLQREAWRDRVNQQLGRTLIREIRFR